MLFPVWGYVHGSGAARGFAAITHVLAFVVPLLFLVGLIGLYARYEGQLRWLGHTGFVLGFLGSAWGAVHGAVDITPWYEYVMGRGWPSLLLAWLPPLLAGLTLVGISVIGMKRFREGAPPLVTGALGWAYYFTDAGSVAETRPGHVVLGVLFSLGWMIMGYALWPRGGQARRPGGGRGLTVRRSLQ